MCLIIIFAECVSGTKAGHGYDGDGFSIGEVQGADLAGGLVAVHQGHHYIHEDDVKGIWPVSAISMFRLLSSTRRTRTPEISFFRISVSSFRISSFRAMSKGSEMVNTEPSFSLLWPSMVPSIFSTSYFTMDIPRPVPS